MLQLIEALSALRRECGPPASRKRLALLRRIAAKAVAGPQAIQSLHEELLFLCAYPDNSRVLRAAQNGLQRIADAAALQKSALPSRRGRPASNDADASRLLNSGIAGTLVHASFTPDLLAWLTGRFGPAVELAWEDGSVGAPLEEFLPALVASAEADGLLSPRLTTREWFRRARGRRYRSDLAWLLAQLDRLACPPVVRDRVFEALDLHVRWRLARRGPSRTFTRFPARPVYFHDELRRDVDLGRLLQAPLPAARQLSGVAAQRLIEVARVTLAVRQRETDAVSYADPREVTLFPLDRGVDVAILGSLPQRRLPVESFFGFVAARNRVPIAYGGGWVFFERCEIGVNLFETFRGGESAYIFGQVLRVYGRHFRVREFTVDPFQFGADNEEAIQSGAFWFYYRLGFRPAEAALLRLAQTEAERIRMQAGYRTPPRILRKLATGHLVLRADDAGRTASPHGAPPRLRTPDLADLGLAVSRWIARRFGGDRATAQRFAQEHVSRLLGVRRTDRWSHDERHWFERLCPLAAMIPDLAAWPRADRRALLLALRAKGGPRERTYALSLQRHARFRAAVAHLARR